MNERPMLVEKHFKVNAYDIDVMGIVSNIVYIRWFEDLRFGLMDQYWSYQEMLKSGQSPILAKTEADYKFPLTIFDKPVGQLWLSDLTRSKWTVSIEVKAEDKIVCIGKQLGYFYDINRKRPLAIPDALKDNYHSSLQKVIECRKTH
jgi:acyl-CoA thioester hydrolase